MTVTEKLPSTDPDLHNLRTGKPVMPLTAGQATAQAMRLRQDGLTYPAIAKVMGRYHGEWKSPQAWYSSLRKAGCPPVRLYAVPPQVRRRRAAEGLAA